MKSPRISPTGEKYLSMSGSDHGSGSGHLDFEVGALASQFAAPIKLKPSTVQDKSKKVLPAFDFNFDDHSGKYLLKSYHYFFIFKLLFQLIYNVYCSFLFLFTSI